MPHPLSQPWAISEAGRQLVLGVWSRGELFHGVVADARARAEAEGNPMQNTAPVAKRADAAMVIPIAGPLFRHASLMTDLSGATSYEAVRGMLAEARAAFHTGDIAGVVLLVDSPGGEVNGLAETADLIRGIAAEMPVVAYVEGMGASAAYWLASAAGHIVAHETAYLGSIGVRLMLVDDEEWQKKEGLRTLEFINAESPDKRSQPVDDEMKARLQALVDDLGGVFIRAVAANRNVSTDRVVNDFGAGDVMRGPAAVTSQMADEIGDLSTALAAMRALPAKGSSMSTPANPTVTNAAAAAAELARATAQRDALIAAAGAKDYDEALGSIRGNADAAKELKELKAQVAASQVSSRLATFRESLAGAIAGKRITPASLRDTVVPMLDEQNAAAAETALAGLAEGQDGIPEQLVAIAGAVSLSEGEAKRVAAYLAKRPAAIVPEPRREAADSRGEPLDETSKRIAAAAAKVRASIDNQAAPAASK